MNVKMDHINVMRMPFALIQKKVMVAFVKTDSMVMDSIVVFYALKEPNHLVGHVLISMNVLKIQQYVSIKTKFAKIPLVHFLVFVLMDSLMIIKNASKRQQ